jgi:hypothetical protein
MFIKWIETIIIEGVRTSKKFCPEELEYTDESQMEK